MTDQHSLLRRELDLGRAVTVLGAPGSGKTALLTELFSGLPADATLVLCPSRGEAAELRDRLASSTASLRPGALARTPQSLAFGLVSAASRAAGEEDVRYLSGADQDAFLADILAGHERGEGRMPSWPEGLDAQVRGTAAFRAELRDLLGRVIEYGITAAQLREASVHGRPAWAAGADILMEYEALTALDPAPRYDSAALMAEAAGLIFQEALNGVGWKPPRWVLVDNAQDLTEAAGRLLDALAERGAQIVLFGCPEAITQGFRGVTGHVLRESAGRAGPRFAVGGRGHATIVLQHVHRHGGALARFSLDWSRRISTFETHGRAHWAASARSEGGRLACERAESAAEEAVLIARRLRERARELLDSGETSRPWSGMAIVCRSATVLPAIRRELLAQGVPLGDRLPAQPLRDHPATRPLLQILQWPETPPEPADVEEILLSPYGGMDAMSLRRLRRRLLTLDTVREGAEQQPAGQETEKRARQDEGSAERAARLLREAVLVSHHPLTGAHPALGRVAAMARAAVEGADADIVEVLFGVWQAGGQAEEWRASALGQGTGGLVEQDTAHERLDSVMRLFALAEKLCEHDPGLGVDAFLGRVAQQEIAQDSLARSGDHQDAVTLTTVAAAGNREWDFVVIPHVQEGQWPNLALRGSLLGAGELVPAVRAPLLGSQTEGAGALAEQLAVARRRVFRDEAGMFLSAVTRARQEVLVTAVDSEEETPSVFLTEITRSAEPEAIEGSSGSHRREQPGEMRSQPASRPDALNDVARTGGVTEAEQYPLTLRGLVGRLRAELSAACLDGVPEDAEEVARVLGALAAAHVPGAAPEEWARMAGWTSSEALAAEEISLSPSAVDLFETCPLRWFLERHGGTAPVEGPAQQIGTLVHAIAEAHPHADAETLVAEFDRRLEAVVFPTDWERSLARERGAAMMGNLASFQLARRDRLAGVEVPVDVGIEAEGESFRIRGVIDRLDSTPEGFEIIDYKTGKQPMSASRAAEAGQLLAYQVALSAGSLLERDGRLLIGDAQDGSPSPQVSGTRLVYLAAGPRASLSQREQAPLEGRSAREAAMSRLAKVAAGMRGPDYPATPSTECRTCPVRAACPAMNGEDLR